MLLQRSKKCRIRTRQKISSAPPPAKSTTTNPPAPAHSKAEEDESSYSSSEEEDKDEKLTLAHKNDSFMSQWTKDILLCFHPRAIVEWSEYAQTRCTSQTLNAIIRVAQMLTELEGRDIEECKEEVDTRQKYSADMNWARNVLLKL